MLQFFISIALVVALVGCGADDATGSKTTSIAPGVYQSKVDFTGANAGRSLSAESNFGADGKYHGRLFYSDGTISCLILDLSAKWTSTETSYTLTDTKAKGRAEDCAEEISEEVSIEDETTTIRNLKSSSFEEYTEFENQPAQWLEFTKI